MNKTTERLVKQTASLQSDLQKLTMDAVNEAAPQVEPEIQAMSIKERAKAENARYIEPKKKMRSLGKLPEKMKAQHAHDWEYVKGIYENFVVGGEPVTFWLCLYPGDHDCMWEIPANVPVYVPRMIAKHLETVQQYHTFDYVPLPTNQLRPDSQGEQFSVVGTQYRGKFRPIGAFN